LEVPGRNIMLRVYPKTRSENSHYLKISLKN
jgi:hypothetical protein